MEIAENRKNKAESDIVSAMNCFILELHRWNKGSIGLCLRPGACRSRKGIGTIMRKRMKMTSLLLAGSMLLGLAGCGAEGADPSQAVSSGADRTEEEMPQDSAPEAVQDPEGESAEEIELLVDMHGWMPTVNTEATAENPTVFLSPQNIADKFHELYPNITISWARTKPVGGLQSELAEWFTTQINAGTCPAIAFSWGTYFQDRDWYLPLDEYLATPNEFVEGNEKWSDMFPEYLWKSTDVADANGRVVAIPIALYAGPATGYYYNKDAFEELELAVPRTWEELVAASRALTEAGYTGIAPVSFLNRIQFPSWVEQFSVGPYIAAGIMEETDYDGDGQVTTTEQLRGVKEGLYNPVDKPYAREMFLQLKRYYTEVLETGWDSTDYNDSWNQGKVGLKEDGLWNLQAENGNKERKCSYGVFAVPPISTDTTEYAVEAQYTEKGPYQPGPDLQLNIMKDAVKDDPALLDAAVKFLKFMTTPENISALVLEQGSDIGAVKGSEVPPILAEWMDQPFAITPKTNWPGAFTDEQNLALDSNMELWVKGSLTDEEFFAKVNEIQQQGADDYISKMEVDTSQW